MLQIGDLRKDGSIVLGKEIYVTSQKVDNTGSIQAEGSLSITGNYVHNLSGSMGIRIFPMNIIQSLMLKVVHPVNVLLCWEVMELRISTRIHLPIQHLRQMEQPMQCEIKRLKLRWHLQMFLN